VNTGDLPERTPWASLNHGGLLIAPAKLVEYFPGDLPPLPWALEARLRRDILRVVEGADAAGALLDTVLEDVLGLERDKWRKGSDVGKQWSRPATSGESIRPARVWMGDRGAVLPIFYPDQAAGGLKVSAGYRLGVGRGRRAASRVIEWLRKGDEKIALLATGRQIRLIHAGTDYDAFCEWDTDLWFESGAPGAQVTALRQLLGPDALVPATEGKPGRLVAAIQASRQGQSELSAALGERVRQAVELLIRESAPVLDRIDGDIRSDAPPTASRAPAEAAPVPIEPVSRRDIYIAATRIVMRCVVILFAEARELLPRRYPLYEESYGLQNLRAQLDRLAGGRAHERLRHSHGAWPRLLSLFSLVFHGSGHERLLIQRYGGGLFTPGAPSSADPVLRALAVLEGVANAPSDSAVHQILDLLTRSPVRVRQGRATRLVVAPVDFSDLSSEYLGILYEGLLDFELRRADDAMVFLDIGDQPVLPLRRLEDMTDAELAKLLEKLKKPAKEKGVEGEDDEEEEDDGEQEDELEEPSAAIDVAAADDDGDIARIVREGAEIWAKRAVHAAGLVRRPRKVDDPRVREQWNRDVEERARTLLARVVPPGAWFLVRWGGTRKGAGTFYTRPQLAGPMVRRALQPLAYDAAPDGTGSVPRKPEEILALKVCDPAMGSGSFLISALRFLTTALLESLHHHGRIREHGGRCLVRLADGLPEDHPSQELLPVPKDDPDLDDRLRSRLKRHVVERCLYGVDIDPLAVELARTALWVETMDYQLPFGFLDHKLKCGDSLVGCWFDRFQDYPALAWNREGGDAKHERFVHHFREAKTKKGETKRSGDKWTRAIKDELDRRIKPELLGWLEEEFARATGQATFSFAGQTPEAIHSAALKAFEELHALPIHHTDRREEIYNERILHSEALGRLRRAFNTWCALWFWPADELEIAPGPRRFLDCSEEARKVVERVNRERRFFHWELEFPDVFREAGAGFDAVVGNPPWEIQKPNSMEFFSNVDPLYRSYGKQEANAQQIALFTESFDAETSWIRYNARLKALSNWTKNAAFPFGAEGEEGNSIGLGAGKQHLTDAWRTRQQIRTGYADREHPFRHQGSADVNTYKLFLESAHALLRKGGRFGFLVPSGLYTDNGSQDLRRLFLRRCEWTHLYAFQNERFVFEGIHHSSKMVVLHIGKAGETKSILTRFRIGPGDSPEAHEVESDLAGVDRYLTLPSERIERFSPRTGSILEVRSDRDLRILERLYAKGVLLGDESPEGWGITYAREFDMTNDSKLFPPRPQWEEKGYKPDEYGHWLKGNWRKHGGAANGTRDWSLVLSVDGSEVISPGEVEDVALPLYEGRVFDSLCFSYQGWVSGRGRSARWRLLPPSQQRIEPQFLMGLKDAATAGDVGRTKVVHMRVGAATNERSSIATTIAGFPCGDTAATFRTSSTRSDLSLAAVISSLAFDFVMRMRLGGLHLDFHVFDQNPLVQRQQAPDSRLGPLALRLAAPAATWARMWLEASELMNVAWYRLWAVTPFERLRIRSIVDAAVADLYGLDLEDFAWILRDCDYPIEKVCDKPFSRTLDPKGFWRADKEKQPELRHPVLSLVAFHELKRVGLDAFLSTNDGEGWMLPETLRLADYGLGHDVRAREPQSVAAVLGPRFFDWQLTKGVEESWDECRHHAKLVDAIVPPPAPRATAEETRLPGKSVAGETDLFGHPLDRDLFGNVIERKRGKGKRR
jgi:Eco57I restriction-modification methylase